MCGSLSWSPYLTSASTAQHLWPLDKKATENGLHEPLIRVRYCERSAWTSVRVWISIRYCTFIRNRDCGSSVWTSIRVRYCQRSTGTSIRVWYCGRSAWTSVRIWASIRVRYCQRSRPDTVSLGLVSLGLLQVSKYIFPPHLGSPGNGTSGLPSHKSQALDQNNRVSG